MMLHRSRNYSMAGPQPIAVSEINGVLDMLGVKSLEERFRTIRHLQAMDEEWIKLQQDGDEGGDDPDETDEA